MAFAQNARQNFDMVGESTSVGEGKLESRGYTFITGSHGSSRTQHAYWWNRSGKSCLHVQSRRGLISDVSDASRSDCHQKASGSDVGAAIAVGVGVAIIGGLLSHKKHHHEDGKHFDNLDHEGNYERGFNDGLHGAAYHNYDRSDQ